MFNLRKIQSEQDIEKAKACIPEGCAEPNWSSCILLERDGEVIGVGGVQYLAKMEPLFVKGENAIGYLMLAAHLEGIFRAANVNAYEFFIQNEFPKHQAFVEEHLPVEWEENKPGKFYVRRFNNGNA